MNDAPPQKAQNTKFRAILKTSRVQLTTVVLQLLGQTPLSALKLHWCRGLMVWAANYCPRYLGSIPFWKKVKFEKWLSVFSICAPWVVAVLWRAMQCHAVPCSAIGSTIKWITEVPPYLWRRMLRHPHISSLSKGSIQVAAASSALIRAAL